ncbi:MAG TPA: sigma 54-interacting transcriptional regulator [Myxococcota bacterium]|jgi:transcriptional regulator with GAF, ATPase, and Fis domain|nr:sigma 54-interacting transcriptional regulator [Myxococcota bacterium]
MAQVQTRVRGVVRTHELFKKVTRIGSGPDNDVVLDDPRVADTHVLLSEESGDWYAVAASRAAELRVNDRKTKKETLRHNDVLSIGDSEVFFFVHDLPGAQGDGGPGGAAASRSGAGAAGAGAAGAGTGGEPGGHITANLPTREEALAELDAYRKVHSFSQKLLGKHELNPLLEELLDLAIGISRADKGFLLLFEGDRVRVHVARNLQRQGIDDAAEQLSDSIIKRVIQERTPLIVSDALHDAQWSSSQSVINLKLCSVMCVPLLARGELLGILYVGNDRVANLFERRSLEVLTVFASQASLIVQNALLFDEMQLESRELAERLEAMRTGSIIGTCQSLQDVLAKGRKVATTDIGVLVMGETGTGKELVARQIHDQSRRAKGPFVTINCGAIPENLLESELFGHVRGAFTGAVATRAGRFQAADGGTLFLDEIGEMPQNLQVKLLRAIQEKVVVKVGDTRPERVDIRILAATNKNLEEEVKRGAFREDLYYRLNVVSLVLPPLRERGEDISVIAHYFLKRYALEYGSKVKGFSPNAVTAMRKYHWPGNIRELENRLKKAVVLADKPLIGVEELDLSEDVLPPILPLEEARAEWQRDYINQVLERNGGNRTKTARDLGVDPRTIFRHLEKEGGDEE